MKTTAALRRRMVIGVVMIVAFITLPHVAMPTVRAQSQPSAAGHDPRGEATGSAKDVVVQDAANPTLADVMATVGHNKVAINMVWVLLCGFLIMFMQTGFALVETGFTRAKNVAHTMAMNFTVYVVGMLGFWICGFALAMGGVGALSTLGGSAILNSEASITLFGKTFGLIGTEGFFLTGSSYDVTVAAMFLFQMVFMDTAATIPTGAMAERWKFSSFILFTLFMSMFVYPIFANWVWGGGWLGAMGQNFGLGHGHVDFAGGSAVHVVGGVAALAGAIVLGPRIGKFSASGEPLAIPGHHIPMAMAGTFILAFGWFGFNAGSTLAGGDLRVSIIAVNTMLASAAGAFTAMLSVWWKFDKPDPSMLANGLLAGLVSITASCAFVNHPSAVIIGGVAGVLVVESVLFIERVLQIDDPVGAVSVHGVCGLFGTLCVGLFADGSYGHGLHGVAGGVRGLFFGDPSQLVAQIIGVVVCVGFVFASCYGFFTLVEVTIGNRVSAQTEIEGLDMPEMGAVGYPDFVLTEGPEGDDDVVPTTAVGSVGTQGPAFKPARDSR